MFCEKQYPITVKDFKGWFTRDFPYSASGDLSGITDQDLLKAFAEANMNFNPTLFSTVDEQKLGFLYLAAHYLVIDIQNSSQGLGGKYEGIMSSKSVGSVSVGYTIPDWVMGHPIYSLLSQSKYGMKYLSLIIPQLVGNISAVHGCTHP
jgi:hypothetical protein